MIANLAKYDDPRGWEVIREVSELGGRANEVRNAWLLRAERGDPEAREFLLASIDDEDLNHGARDEVFEGLRCFEDDEVRAVIERIASDETEDQSRRYYAWGVLAYWRDPRARNFWLECLAGEDTTRRIAAVTALSNYDNPEVWELIRHAAENDPDRQVVKEAQKQLDKREGE